MTDSTWLSTLGGPFIAIAVEDLPSWGGADPPEDERLIEVGRQFDPLGPATDYDRACAVPERIGTVNVGAGQGLVLSSETRKVGWFPIDRSSGHIVRILSVDDREGLLEIVRHLTIEDFGARSVVWRVSSSPVRLFDSGMAGRTIVTDWIDMQLEPGTYEIRSMELDRKGVAQALIHRLQLLAPKE